LFLLNKYSLDHDCLSLPTPLLEFRQRFRTDYKNSSSPILVHCRLKKTLNCLNLIKLFSAGVGRSGTFIALDALLEMAQSQDTIDILEFTYRMR
jgi:protein tyrosine phosphatase